MENKEKLKLYNKEKLIDIIEKLSVEFAIKNQQYEYIRHNDFSKKLQYNINKALDYIDSILTFNECDINDIKTIKEILKGGEKNERKR